MIIQTVTLIRDMHVVNCTSGILNIDGNLFYTLENSWKNNQEVISCIPEGEYFSSYMEETEENIFSNVYLINGVKNRNKIFIQTGNYIKDTTGCILIGLRRHIKQKYVYLSSSRKAMKKFLKISKKENILLKIHNG